MGDTIVYAAANGLDDCAGSQDFSDGWIRGSKITTPNTVDGTIVSIGLKSPGDADTDAWLAIYSSGGAARIAYVNISSLAAGWNDYTVSVAATKNTRYDILQCAADAQTCNVYTKNSTGAGPLYYKTGTYNATPPASVSEGSLADYKLGVRVTYRTADAAYIPGIMQTRIIPSQIGG